MGCSSFDNVITNPMSTTVQPSPDRGLKTRIQPLSAFSDNYIWLISNGETAVVVDPGDAVPVLDALDRFKLRLTAILLTHHHPDHVGGVQRLVDASGATVYGPATEDLPVCDTAMKGGARFEDSALGIDLTVIDVPGHTAGHIAYAGSVGGTPAVFCGDTLFAAGCGRVFEGTPGQMTKSLSALAVLPPETHVFCAHEYTLSNMRWAREVEPANTELQQWQAEAIRQRDQGEPTVPSRIGQELACNPFMRTAVPSVVKSATQWAQRKLDTPVEVFAALREWKNSFR